MGSRSNHPNTRLYLYTIPDTKIDIVKSDISKYHPKALVVSLFIHSVSYYGFKIKVILVIF